MAGKTKPEKGKSPTNKRKSPLNKKKIALKIEIIIRNLHNYRFPWHSYPATN